MLASPRTVSLSTAWQAVGPAQVASLAYGKVTGRVTAIAVDPADATGNTVYVGTTGGGVWRSANAAGAAANVTFSPLTDTLPVFSLDSGNPAIASLSIGALSVANGVVLAGTGDTNDALDSYYGSGLLRSADGGATWTLTQQSNDGANGVHSFVGLGFAGLAWSTASPKVVVAAVSEAVEGELVNAGDAEYSTRGLYFSTDAGVSWQMATIKDGSQIVQQPLANGQNLGGNAVTAVVWNPVRQRFYAAVRFHGYYESADGAVWTRLAAQPGAGLMAAACPANPGGTGSANCPIFRGALAVEPESGDTYAFTVDAANGDQGIWRDVCGAASGSCGSGEVAFGVQLNAGPLETSGVVQQGDYDLTLAAQASGGNTLLFAGTVDLYRCSLTTAAAGAGGCSFRNTTNVEDGCAAPAMVAPAQHALAALAGGALPLLFLGNDGGLWRSLDGVAETGSPCSATDATHFDNLNGGLGSLAEVVQFSQHPSDPNTLLVGLGANGTAATASAAANSPWEQLGDGEGGFSAIDPVTPANRYVSTAAGVSITYCGQGSSCSAAEFDGLPVIGAPQVDEDASLIDPPWLLDPALSSNVVIGTCRVWRGPAADGSTWPGANVLSTQFGGPQGGSQSAACDATNNYVRSLAAGGPASTGATAAASGSTVLYAGMAGSLDGGGTVGGHLFATSAANAASSATAWTDLAGSPVVNDASSGGVFNAGGFDVSSIAVDSHDATGQTVYATVMGFSGNGISANHVYRSADGGAHWTNITSNLPDAPANSVVVDPNDANTVYVAMDTGVYVTAEVTSCTTANCWSVYGTGLPNAPVVQLVASATVPVGDAAGVLRAATYGRGIWEIPLLTATPVASAAMTLSPAAVTFGTQAVGTTSAAQTVTVTNSGTAALVVSGVVAAGEFAETDDCVGATVAPGASCAVQVVFLPTAAGAASGLLTVSGNVTGGSATAQLTGTAVAAAAIVLTPGSLNFGTAQVGAASAVQNITVSNTGGVTASLTTITVAGDFTTTAETCGLTLVAGTGCTVSLVFRPTAEGARTGTMSVTDSAGTQTASLSGTGSSPPTDTLAPLSLTFGTQAAGTASAAQALTLTNTGDDPLTLIAVQVSNANFTAINACGPSLAGRSSCAIQVAFTPTVAGALTATLTVSDQLRSQTVALSGTGVAPPTVAVAPGALTFAATPVGGSSAAQTVAITNSGDGSLTVGQIATTGEFAETDACVGKVLTGGASCSVAVVFHPTAAGSQTGVLTVMGTGTGTTVAGGMATVALTGSGAAPAAIVLDPVSANFGTVTLGSSSAAQYVTISNTGGVAATVGGVSVSGDFALSANTCGSSLGPSTGCTVGIVFTPTASGARTGVLTVTDSVGTQTAALTGTGASPATDGLSPLSLTFAPQQENTQSAAQAVTLTNTGDNALTLISAQITSGDFAATSACGSSLMGHASCAILVESIPKSVGPGSGVLTVSDQFRTQTVALSGTGVAPPGVTLSPLAGLTFGATGVTTSSAPQTMTLSNMGGAPLTISAITVAGDFAIPAATNTCTAVVAVGGSCTFQVVFSPVAGGARAGTVSVTTNAPGSPLTVPLAGMGVDFSLSANGAASVTVASGQPAVFPLLLSSAAGISGTAAMACAGAPVNATCVVTPAAVPLGTAVTVSLTVETGVAAAASLAGSKVWWVVVLPLALPFRRRLRRFGSLLVLAGVMVMVGCGSGRTIPPSSVGDAGGTPPVVTASGTYTIVASATSAGLTRSVTLTLVVQ
jgi:hypothetical protein